MEKGDQIFAYIKNRWVVASYLGKKGKVYFVQYFDEGLQESVVTETKKIKDIF